MNAAMFLYAGKNIFQPDLTMTVFHSIFVRK